MPLPNSTSMQLGRRIAQARRAAGLTQAELAVRLNWPRDTLIHYEYGRRNLSTARLIELAAALNLAPAALLIDDPELARILTELSNDPTLLRQVRFFLSTLAADHAPYEP